MRGATITLDRLMAGWLNIYMKKILPLLLAACMASLGASTSGEQNPFDLTTLLGETFHQCRILKATPEAVTISHDKGVSKISFENLNDEWKKRFNYDPEKAAVFQKEEARRMAEAEQKKRQLQMDYERAQNDLITSLALAESRKTQKMEESIALQQAQVTAVAVSQPGWLLPMTGFPLPDTGAGIMTAMTSNTTPTSVASAGAVQSTTEVIVPATTPLSQVYTPGVTGGQRYIINQGTIFTPGDGSLYYINPGYGYGYGTPGYYNPPMIVCPPGANQPHLHQRTPAPSGPVSGTIRIGPGVIHIGP